MFSCVDAGSDMQTADLEMHGQASVQVAWQFENNELCATGAGEKIRIRVNDVISVRYPGRNKALIAFGNDGEHTLQIHFPNIAGLLHEHWGAFPEQKRNAGSFAGPVFILLTSGIALVIAVVLLFYFWGMPWLVRKAVDFVPIEKEISMGKEIAKNILAETPPDSVASNVLNSFAEELDFRSEYPLHFNVVNDSTVNAFALPGGEIVVYAGILEKLNHPGQLAALLSHEASHVNYRHSLHGMVDKIFWSALIAMAVGDGGIVEALSAQSNEFRSLAYSRDLETQADTAGATLLKRNGIAIRHMVGLLEILQLEAQGSHVPEFLQTHPLPETRIERLEILANEEEDKRIKPQLDSLFKLLKSKNSW